MVFIKSNYENQKNTSEIVPGSWKDGPVFILNQSSDRETKTEPNKKYIKYRI